MKFLVMGAGAVGGIVAAHTGATLVARGANLEALRNGLTMYTPDGVRTVRVDVVERPIAVDVVLLAVKTQDAPDALRALSVLASSTPIVCMTNGIEVERMALRWFDRVYGMCVNIPATHVEPGVVESWGVPFAGMFDIGRYPDGVDDLCTRVAAAFEAGGLSSRTLPDVMRWKRGKLVFNLSNALDALCGPGSRTHPIVGELRAEAKRVLAAAGLSTTTDDEANARRGDFKTGTIAGRARIGGSTWQSLARGATVLECEFLNGEIAMLGRLHGVATPLNDALLREVTRAVGQPPGAQSIDDVALRIQATPRT
jgi:2-dehydropantoate 2-reductase